MADEVEYDENGDEIVVEEKDNEVIETLQKEIAELKESSNPNWAKARGKIAAQAEALKAQGIEVDEDGKAVDKGTAGVDVDEMIKKAQEAGANAATSQLLGGELKRQLSVYDDESAKVVKSIYAKLTKDESVDMENMSTFIRQAESAAKSDPDIDIKTIQNAVGSGSGRGPGTRPAGESTLSEKDAQTTGEAMGLPFAINKDKK